MVYSFCEVTESPMFGVPGFTWMASRQTPAALLAFFCARTLVLLHAKNDAWLAS